MPRINLSSAVTQNVRLRSTPSSLLKTLLECLIHIGGRVQSLPSHSPFLRNFGPAGESIDSLYLALHFVPELLAMNEQVFLAVEV